MTPAQFLAAVAHLAASKFVEGGFSRPDAELSATAIIEDAGVRFVVSCTPYEGRATISPSTLENISAFQSSQGPSKCPNSKLTGEQQKVVDALRSATSARKAAWIALKVGKPNNGTFRGRLSKMVKLGVLSKVDNGYILA